jgi:hypothetical protein
MQLYITHGASQKSVPLDECTLEYIFFFVYIRRLFHDSYWLI